MLDNIMQKSARIEDAYAGNLDGLKQRVEKAGVSNELLAAFVLQGQLAQREAAQRNAAMQQQSNPQTVTQQMQLALDANSSPSEGEVVERTGIAGQQMPQGPQGPQGGGGIASQAGPVKLAGGGIVAFYSGGPISEITDEDVAAYRAANPLEAGNLPTQVIKNKIYVEANPQLDKYLESIPDSGAQRYKKRLDAEAQKKDQVERKSRVEAKNKARTGIESTLPPALNPYDNLLGSSDPLAPRSGVLAPRMPTGSGVMMTPEAVKETAAAAKLSPAVVPPAAPAIDPDAGIKAALEKSANLDPVAQAKARSAAVKDDLGLAEGIATLGDRKGRRERAYEETTASGMDNLIDLLTAGGRGGITGVGARSGQLRREENARRMAYEDTLDGIEDKTMTLRSTIGGKAATSYDNTMKTMLTVQQNAQTSILNLSASEQKAIRETRANDLAEARNDLSRENLLLNTVEGVEKQQEIITDTQQTVAEDFNLRYDSELREAMTAVREGEDNAEEELKILQDRISLEMRNDPRWVTSEVRQEMIDGIAERNTALIKAQRERLGGSAISGKTGDKINTALGI